MYEDSDYCGNQALDGGGRPGERTGHVDRTYRAELVELMSGGGRGGVKLDREAVLVQTMCRGAVKLLTKMTSAPSAQEAYHRRPSDVFR